MKYLVKDAIQGTLLRIENTMDDAILEKDKWQAISSKHKAVIETVEEEEQTMKYELVIIWANPDGEKVVYEYCSEEDARSAENGMRMALGNQVLWSCVRPKF